MIDLFPFAAPLLRQLPPEWAHGLTLLAIRSGLAPQGPGTGPILQCQVAGLDFANPLGLAAGFDKNAEAVNGLWRLGFGFVEAGTLTPRPQPGNPKPRLFRLPADRAVINRLGFNNKGLEAALNRISKLPRHGVLGINIGKNRDSGDAIADYAHAAGRAAPSADYLTVNLSSPNTPGLRDLQAAETLAPLLKAVLAARDAACRDQKRQPPLFLKIAPDLSPSERRSIAETVLAEGIDGLIVGNTTVARPNGLHDRRAAETGGLSGPPLFEPSTEILADMYRLTQGRIPLIGVGGVSSAADAYAKIRAGASLMQLYTGLIYQGPALIKAILSGLAEHLAKDGYSSVNQAVGADAPDKPT